MDARRRGGFQPSFERWVPSCRSYVVLPQHHSCDSAAVHPHRVRSVVQFIEMSVVELVVLC